MKVCKDLLQHPLRPSVRIRAGSLRALFSDRDERRITVYGCGRTEDNVLHAVVSHHITEVDGSADIVLIVLQRLSHGLAYRFQACKMDDRFDLLFLEDLIHRFLVADIRFIECKVLSCDLFYTVKGFFRCIVKVVRYNNVIACI